jgi:hypothetical protein
VHGSLFEAIFLDVSGQNHDLVSQVALACTSPEHTLKFARDQGMTTLLHDGVIKVIQDRTDFKQVKAVAIR